MTLWAGYTFGVLSKRGNGSSEAIVPIVKCHSKLACLGGETSLCAGGYVDTRCRYKRLPPDRLPRTLRGSQCAVLYGVVHYVLEVL
jgi:hypothetical protein